MPRAVARPGGTAPLAAPSFHWRLLLADQRLGPRWLRAAPAQAPARRGYPRALLRGVGSRAVGGPCVWVRTMVPPEAFSGALLVRTLIFLLFWTAGACIFTPLS